MGFKSIWILVAMVALGLLYLGVSTFLSDKSNYTYMVDGMVCETYNKENNTLHNCNVFFLGKNGVDILNPTNIIKQIRE